MIFTYRVRVHIKVEQDAVGAMEELGHADGLELLAAKNEGEHGGLIQLDDQVIAKRPEEAYRKVMNATEAMLDCGNFDITYEEKVSVSEVN